jgi:murein DD-endopeptidase MepM/ murein hydrolase activator NlpD
MKIIIVDQKYDDTKSLVIKGWVCVFITFCFLGLPVVLGYYGYQFSAGKNTEIYSGEAAQPLVDKLVQVNHGNGYESIYSHNQEILLNAGDIIKKGQIVALSSNFGRSTGPHVHFEIHKNGRIIDPASYISRTNR